MLLLPLAFCLARVSHAGVYLTDSEYSAIRGELQRMSEAAMRLNSELNAQKQQSQTLLETSQALRAGLESALAKLEKSQASLDQSEAELAGLLTELAGLRSGYSALWESWTLQKNETRKWGRLAAAGWISAGLALAGGVLWGVLK
jgi:septal ring factor EnvC (AmiA/AmiB activator)